MKIFVAIVSTALLTVPVTWWLADHFSGSESHPTAPPGRRVLYYQSAMHPWVKSDQPGRCTVCGMELTPVYEGDPAPSGADDVVALSPSMVRILHVATAEAKTEPIHRTLRVSGTIDDNIAKHRVLSATVPGRIETLHVNYVGAEVTAGQPLAEIYSQRLLQAESEYRVLAAPDRPRAAFRLKQLGLTDAQIEQLPQKPTNSLTSSILAPVSGTVVAQSVYAGQYVEEGAKLFEIADFSTMWFVFPAYEADLPWLAIGQPVRVSTPSLPGHVSEGKITFIDPNLDETTRSAKVRVDLENPLVNGRRTFLHRVFADGEIAVASPAALAVPKSAVIQTGPQAVVYVEKSEGAYQRRAVTTGLRGDALVQITQGLEPGERVVERGTLLIDGQAEMNRVLGSSEPEKATPHEHGGQALGEVESAALAGFVATADALAAALAADDVVAFNAAAAKAPAAADKLATALAGHDEWKPPLEAITGFARFEPAADLAAARMAFHHFTTAATPFLQTVAGSGQDAPFSVWECPMADRAIPGVAKKARWIQAKGRAVANPFFGQEMLDCAVEVKP